MCSEIIILFFDRHACECKSVDTDSMAPAKQGAARSWLECLDVLLGMYIFTSRNIKINAKTKWPIFSRRHYQCIFMSENVWIAIKITLKFISMCTINNILALVQIMAWCRAGDKPFSEPMLVSLLTHICVIRPQWVNSVCQEVYTSHLIIAR